MTRRAGRLVLLAILASSAAVYFSCSQTSDVLTPVERTDMFLTPFGLPTAPPGMIYELWVADADDTISLGKFRYNQFWKRFHDEDGNIRADSNHFVLDDDFLRFNSMFVSIETDSDGHASPGPIMLIDDVSLPSNDPVDLRFPMYDSLNYIAFLTFNFETPSDSSRDPVNAGKGLWFSDFHWNQDSIQDTISLDSARLVYGEDSTIIDTTYTTYVDSIFDTTLVVMTRIFGLDTFMTTVIRFDSNVQIDTTYPYTVQKTGTGQTAFWYTFGRHDWPDTLIRDTDNFDPGTLPFNDSVTDTFFYEQFIQLQDPLIDYSSWGWKYKGWVVSPTVPKTVLGEITGPAWDKEPNDSESDSLIPGYDGGLLTIGEFGDPAGPDNADTFTLGPRVPPFPGEDFLVNLPPEMAAWDGFVDSVNGRISGSVFITLQPDNFNSDTTNFPLFVLIGKVPTDADSVTFPNFEADDQRFEMKAQTDLVKKSRKGLPSIDVTIRRF